MGNVRQPVRSTPPHYGGGRTRSARAHDRTHVMQPRASTIDGNGARLVRGHLAAACLDPRSRVAGAAKSCGDMAEQARVTSTPQELFNRHILSWIGSGDRRSGQIKRWQVESHDNGRWRNVRVSLRKSVRGFCLCQKKMAQCHLSAVWNFPFYLIR